MITEPFCHSSGLLPASTQSILLTFLTILIKISAERKDVCLHVSCWFFPPFRGQSWIWGSQDQTVTGHPLPPLQDQPFPSPQCSMKIFSMYGTMWKKLAVLFRSLGSGDRLVGNTLNVCLSEVGFLLGAFCQDSLAGYKTLAFQFCSPHSAFGTLIFYCCSWDPSLC